MKKLWLIPILALAIAGCGNNEEIVEEEESVEVVELEETDSENTEIEIEEEAEINEEISSDSKTADYEENELLEEHLSLDELTPQVETDNPNKRIILFENQSGEKVYKSIFIKNDQHLKIIDLNGDGLVYEGHL